LPAVIARKRNDAAICPVRARSARGIAASLRSSL
jgi:hypothetical protein